MSSRRLTGDAARAGEPMAWRIVPGPGAGASGALRCLYEPETGSLPRIPSTSENEPDLNERLRQAHQGGYQEGQAAAVQAAGARLDAAVSRLAGMVEELAGTRGRLRREAEKDLVGLAIAIARRILRRQVSIDPDTVLGVAKVALEKLDTQEVHRLRLNPDDMALVGNHLEHLGLRRDVEIIPDPAVERGGAIFDTDRGTLDASIEGQLREIDRGLADLVERR